MKHVGLRLWRLIYPGVKQAIKPSAFLQAVTKLSLPAHLGCTHWWQQKECIMSPFDSKAGKCSLLGRTWHASSRLSSAPVCMGQWKKTGVEWYLAVLIDLPPADPLLAKGAPRDWISTQTGSGGRWVLSSSCCFLTFHTSPEQVFRDTLPILGNELHSLM